MTYTASTLLETLRRSYATPDSKPDAGLFLAEVEAPAHHGVVRRADALWVPWTLSGGYGQLHGHEIKVSRSDVLAALAAAGLLAAAWMRYCYRWWLVVADAKLVTGLDVPDSWGVMAPPSGRRTRAMTILVPAPKLTPTAGADGMARVAIVSAHRLSEALGQARHDLRDREDDLRRVHVALTDAQVSRAGYSNPQARVAVQVVEAVSQRMKRDRLWVSEDEQVSAIADAVVDTLAARSAAKNTAAAVLRTRDEFERLVSQVAEHFDSPAFTRLAREVDPT